MSDQEADRSPKETPPPLPSTIVGEIRPTPVVAHNVWVGISGGHLVLAHFFADHYAPPVKWAWHSDEMGTVTEVPDELHIVREYVATLAIPPSHVREIAARLIGAADAIDRANAHAARLAQEAETSDE
ncbi:MAG: hypothetical protein OXF01_19135 [Gemmatimonadetes bacterium]|nr:hypothetical protein [Gemmatimonadota bacterium]